MTTTKVGATFDITKFQDPDDYLVDDFTMIYSHPSIEEAFLFEEDLLDNGFFNTTEWLNLLPNRIYRIFIVILIEPQYSDHFEYGKEFDGWDWEVLILTHEDLGETTNDKSLISQ